MRPRVLALLALPVTAALFLWRHATDQWTPKAADFTQGWWTFSDHSRYLRSTLAWASGNLDPAQHWYLPGYPLLGVPFVHITPADPFLLPDLALLCLSVWLMGALTTQLAPNWRWARPAGTWIFVATLLHPMVLMNWVVPWTTTPAAALTLGCAVAVLAFMARTGWPPVLTAALCGTGIAAFRPSDAALVCTIAGVAIVARMVSTRPGLPIVARCVAAGGLGGAVVLGLVVAGHWAVHGWTLGPYLDYSAVLGFEWRLIPLHWVMLVLDPRPLLPESPGLIGHFPWIVPGLAGMVTAVAAPPFGGARARQVFLVALAAGHVALYLAYRDLHPQGLWRFLNYHYFKWVLPVFAWQALMLAACLVRRPVAAALGVVTAAALLLWRVELKIVGPVGTSAAGSLPIPAGLSVQDALLVRAAGDFESIHHGNHNFYFGPNDSLWMGATGRIVAYPIPGGIMLAPLLPLPPGAGRAVMDKAAQLADSPVLRARQMMRFGVPCWLPRVLGRPSRCTYRSPLT